MNINKELNSRLFDRSENEQIHEEFNREYGFYSNIVRGDIEAVKNSFCNPNNENMFENEQYGKLSANKLMNIRYHYVVSVSLITRLCVEHGLDRELAYTLSDLYISEMDKLSRPEQILNLYNQMQLAFTKKMSELPKKKIHSIQIVKAMNYVCSHRTEKMTAESIADILGISRGYLSTLFKKETGISISDYIRREKLGAAANMLIYSDFSYSDIAEYFGFASQSHFIQCFKRELGCTPSEYRKQNFRG